MRRQVQPVRSVRLHCRRRRCHRVDVSVASGGGAGPANRSAPRARRHARSTRRTECQGPISIPRVAQSSAGRVAAARESPFPRHLRADRGARRRAVSHAGAFPVRSCESAMLVGQGHGRIHAPDAVPVGQPAGRSAARLEPAQAGRGIRGRVQFPGSSRNASCWASRLRNCRTAKRWW